MRVRLLVLWVIWLGRSIVERAVVVCFFVHLYISMYII